MAETVANYIVLIYTHTHTEESRKFKASIVA